MKNTRQRLVEVMSKVNNLNESVLDMNTKKYIIDDFINYAIQFLDLENDEPEINLIDQDGAAAQLKSFGAFMVDSGVINVVITNRNLADILRTLAHEMVHYKQKIENRLEPNSGDDGSEIENEANATAAVIMRKYGKINPDIFE